MKKISVWAGTGILMLAIGLAGVSCSQEQGKEQIKGSARERAMLPELQEKALEKELPSAGHGGKTAEGPKQGSEGSGKASMVIAKVNGIDITINELLGEMNTIAPQFIKNASERTPEIDKKVKETALGILIFRELAVQEADRQGIKAQPTAVAEAKKKLKQDLGSEDNYRNYLRKMHLTEESLAMLLKRDILFTQIITKEIFEKAKADDKIAIEKRKKEWEENLKKKAKIEILLPKVEREIAKNAHRGK